jgi:uncharacterized protein YkwD
MAASTIPHQWLWLLLAGLAAATTARADALSAVQILREGGCGGTLPAAPPLHHNALLDRAAQEWASGRQPAAAIERSGYVAQSSATVHISGPDSSHIQLLKQSGCRALADRALSDIGLYRHGADHWLVLASAYTVPARAQAPVLAARALQLVNDVRARGARCGEKSFGPAPPVRLSGTLAEVALGHASDMALHDYFEHQDLSGRSPADRVRAIGYRETLVGENIAYGPQSADEVVQGWLDSPGHCENIMDPRFSEMGLAFAAGQASRRGLYWVQLLAAPRA